MFRKFLRSKIHKAHITHADFNYEGSITLSPQLLEAADIKPFEAVDIWNVTNGNRLETYAILGEDDTSDISINGAAAHLCSPGDVIIIACFGFYTDQDKSFEKPKVVFVDKNNKIKEIAPEIPGPKIR